MLFKQSLSLKYSPRPALTFFPDTPFCHHLLTAAATGLYLSFLYTMKMVYVTMGLLLMAGSVGGAPVVGGKLLEILAVWSRQSTE